MPSGCPPHGPGSPFLFQLPPGGSPLWQVCRKRGSPDSPWKRTPISQLEDLVGVQQLPETAKQVPAFEAPTLGVHQHQEGSAVWGQLRVLRGRVG